MNRESYAIKVIEGQEFVVESEALNVLFDTCFELGKVRVKSSSEVAFRVYAETNKQVVAHGVAFVRDMSQGGVSFKAGIIGDIAVHPEYRGKGLSKYIVSLIDNYLFNIGIQISFLFAYEPKVYESSGYNQLSVPIHYYDTNDNDWRTYVYNGGMYKSLDGSSLGKETIEFNGRVH